MPAIVGREGELQAVESFLADGQGALVLEGEVGIGKTTVWLAGVDTAGKRGLRLLVARPAETESALSHAGLGDLLHEVLDEVLPSLPQPRRKALEVALLLEEPEGPAPDPRALAVATQNALEVLARDGTVVVAVDDVQWLDAASSAALAFAARRLRTADVRFLFSRRVPADDAGPLDGERLSIGPLSLGAIHRLLRDRLGRTLPRIALHRLYDASGGNPFFALELARSLSSDARRRICWTTRSSARSTPMWCSSTVASSASPIPSSRRSSTRAHELAARLLTDAARGRERAEALALLGEIEARAGSPPAARGYLLEGLQEAAGMPDLEVVLHQLLSVVIRGAEGVAVAEHHALAAVVAAERAGGDALTARALSALAAIRFSGGEPEAVALARRAFELARSADDPVALVDATQALGHCLCWAGPFDEARDVLRESYAVAMERDEGEAAVALWYLAVAEWRAGRWESAFEHAERARDLSALDAEPGEEGKWGIEPLALVHASYGRIDDARALTETSYTLSVADGSRFGRRVLQHAIRGVVEHWAGDAERAVEEFAAGAELRRASGNREPAMAFDVPDHVEALLELGRVDDAVAVLDPWEADAKRLERRFELAHAARCRGLVAAARGDVAGAAALLDDAFDRHDAAGDPFGRARALLALGVALRRTRRKRPAREALERALAGFDALGAAGWAGRVRAELGRVGGRTRADGLTPAERRVAELVARGSTNREVAAALFLAERTVESHLSHVYAKLGVRSRTELARALD